MSASGPGSRPALRVIPRPEVAPAGAPPPPVSGAFAALSRGRCPRCRSGRIFAGAARMNPACPSCGLRFEREPGYFMGALYLSYGMAIPAIGLLALLVHALWPELSAGWALLGGSLAFLPLVLPVFRAARVLWIHFDRAIDRSP